MSDHIARQALSRMNLSVVAIAAHMGAAAIAADMTQMAKTDPAEAHAKFMEQRRAELCAAYGYEEPNQRKPFAFAAGIAIIPITGTLINRFGQSYGYVTGYNFIRQQTALALADDDVKGILYDAHSYGGEVSGCFEAADVIYQAGKKKPTMAYVDTAAYSACYALVSGVRKIVSTPSGGQGSIGVIAMHVDMSKWLNEIGLNITLITFGEHKADGNPFEPLPTEVRKNIQASVNKTGEKFVALVAKHRNLDAKVVRDTQALTYSADDALSLGLIDAIATPEAAARAFLGELSGSNSNPSTKAEVSMTQATEPGTTAAAPAPATTTAATPAPSPAPAAAAAGPTAEEARTAERARVSGILGCEEAKGRESLANHLAMNTDMSVDQAKAALSAAPKGTAAAAPAANGFAAAMDRGTHPNVGAEGAGGDGEQTSAADRILASQAAATGYRAPTK